MYTEAIAAHRRVLSLDPKYKDSLYQLGILYLMQGDVAQANAMAQRLQPLDPGLAKEIQTLLRK